MGPLQLRGAQRERASILGHVSKRARAREQKDVRARGARAKRGARARFASKTRCAREMRERGARAKKMARRRYASNARSHTSTRTRAPCRRAHAFK